MRLLTLLGGGRGGGKGGGPIREVNVPGSEECIVSFVICVAPKQLTYINFNYSR